ncbi:hypothetical protein CcCBS67573_g10552 [Chytriomyces confervae]|uniref:Uncharacterized protein n=1 Tax=Chytriomyces confervae TaxID=246404 RepID=A0A507CRL1_9FUNG|nr:hypothetical protein CcCBS67573_g10552 [Chytriomyces confervae]
MSRIEPHSSLGWPNFHASILCSLMKLPMMTKHWKDVMAGHHVAAAHDILHHLFEELDTQLKAPFHCFTDFYHFKSLKDQ